MIGVAGANDCRGATGVSAHGIEVVSQLNCLIDGSCTACVIFAQRERGSHRHEDADVGDSPIAAP